MDSNVTRRKPSNGGEYLFWLFGGSLVLWGLMIAKNLLIAPSPGAWALSPFLDVVVRVDLLKVGRDIAALLLLLDIAVVALAWLAAWSGVQQAARRLLSGAAERP